MLGSTYTGDHTLQRIRRSIKKAQPTAGLVAAACALIFLFKAKREINEVNPIKFINRRLFYFSLKTFRRIHPQEVRY